MQPPASDLCIPVLPTDGLWLAETVERARKGDRAAFEALYGYYRRPVWRRLVHLIRDQESAEDLCQETFLCVWKKLPETDSNLQFESWLYRIAVNRGIDYLRHVRKIQFFPLLVDEVEGLNFPVFPGVTGHEEHICNREVLLEALARLSPRYRTCLLLQDLWGYSQREVAQLLEISEKCVSGYVSRGRQQLRQLYWHLTDELGSLRKEV